MFLQGTHSLYSLHSVWIWIHWEGTSTEKLSFIRPCSRSHPIIGCYSSLEADLGGTKLNHTTQGSLITFDPCAVLICQTCVTSGGTWPCYASVPAHCSVLPSSLLGLFVYQLKADYLQPLDYTRRCWDCLCIWVLVLVDRKQSSWGECFH